MEDERARFISLEGKESEERNRASFPRWGKLRVISYHFTELKRNHGFGDAYSPGTQVDSKRGLGYTFILLIPLIDKESKWKRH